MSLPLDVKVEKALGFLKLHEPDAIHLSSDGYYLAFSGGKDSVVMKRLARMAGVDFKDHYNNTTIDPPELVRFIKDEHPETTWNSKGVHLCTRIVQKRNPPTRLGRWCCSEYKEQGGNGLFKLIGVRAAESPRRKGMWKPFMINKRKGLIGCPILYWTDEDIWNFIKRENIPYCKLYDEGFKRLGCVGCPMGGPKSQRKEFDRWPRYEALWKKAFKRLYEGYRDEPNRKGEPRFFAKYDCWEDFWDWWISGKKGVAPAVCQGQFMFTSEEEFEEADLTL